MLVIDHRMSTETAIVWLRRDLRVTDNLALNHAMEGGTRVIPVFVWSPEEEAPWQPGAASRWWLHHSLTSLEASLKKRGSRLIVRRGESAKELRAIADEVGATTLHFSRLIDPACAQRDADLCESMGIKTQVHDANLLHRPENLFTQSGTPYRVFTPFWKTAREQVANEEPIPAPTKIKGPETWPESLSIDDLALLPRIDWAAGFRETWKPGEALAQRSLKNFLATDVAEYDEGRDFPAQPLTSRLSPHLHFGEISVRQIWWEAKRAWEMAESKEERKSIDRFLAEVGWREFAHHLLFHFPRTTEEPLREEFQRFPWRDDDGALARWQRGETGVPIVDAGMRELWHTGWMHNRVRMIVGSYLVKNLLLPWQAGARWFWDTLVDADLASNTLGWQWIAGCGADAAPYFRIFNPTLQAKRYDPENAYIDHWASDAPKEPMIDHAEARDRALAAFESLKKS